MQFGGEQKKRLKYPLRVQLYDKPPEDDISLEEFYLLGKKRMEVLRAVERAAHQEGWKDKPLKEFSEHFSEHSIRGPRPSQEDINKQDECRRKDHISHYILLLAYCRTEELRRWFLTQETELFKYRLHQSRSERNELLQYYKNDLHFEQAMVGELDAVAKGYISKNHKDTLYKVHFSRALELVRTRKAVVYKGYAYVPTLLLDSLLAGHFRMKLSEALAVMSQHISSIDEDDRLRPFLRQLNSLYTGEEYTGSNVAAGSVKLDNIDNLVKESFPLCMRQLHDQLRSDHHLRHGGRMQYGLFLKGIGLTLQQSLTFWRKEFTKRMDPETFDKSYSYNIRHNYGKEGRRTNYTPFSCNRIITSNPPSAGDHHGCPFRHWDAGSLKNKLKSLGLTHKGVLEITSKAEGGHYQIACQQLFELTHPNYHGNLVVEHPNNYYFESRKFRVGEDQGVKQAGENEPMDTTEQ